NPDPVVVLAIDDRIGDVEISHAFVTDDGASLRLSSGLPIDGDIVGATGGDQRRKDKIGVVACDEYVVAGVIHQLHRIAGAVYEPYEGAANRETRLRTRDLNGGDVTGGGSGTISDRAGLPRV